MRRSVFEPVADATTFAAAQQVLRGCEGSNLALLSASAMRAAPLARHWRLVTAMGMVAAACPLDTCGSGGLPLWARLLGGRVMP